MNDDDLRELGEKGNPDYWGYPGQKPLHIKYVGEDKVVVERPVEKPLHWSERQKLGYKPEPLSPRIYGDNDKSSPEQNWEEL